MILAIRTRKKKQLVDPIPQKKEQSFDPALPVKK